MKKAQVLLLLAAALVLCACAPAVAAPEPTPTQEPAPTPIGTPDPRWAVMCVELEENLDVCFLAPDKIKTNLFTGPVVKVKLNLVTLAGGIRTRTIEVGEVQKEEIGYETFVLEITKDVTNFDRVFVYIVIEGREFEFGFPIVECSPQ